MFLICDQNDIVQDIATEKANLSRGFGFEKYKLYENVDFKNAFVGDHYIDGVIIPNGPKQQERELRLQQESMISAKAREIAIIELKKEGKLPPDFEG